MLSQGVRRVLVLLVMGLTLTGTLVALFVGRWPLVLLGVTATVIGWFACTFLLPSSAGNGRAGSR